MTSIEEYQVSDASVFDEESLVGFVEKWWEGSDGESVEEFVIKGMKEDVDLRRRIVEFYHKYVVCVRDLDVVRAELHGGGHIFTQVTASDAAYAALVFVDNCTGWTDTIVKKRRDPGYKPAQDNKTKWKKVKGKTPYVDRVCKDAKSFYSRAVTVFGVFHSEQEDLSSDLFGDSIQAMMGEHSRDWWKGTVAVSKLKKRKAPNKVVGAPGVSQAPTLNKGALAAYKKKYKGGAGKGHSATDMPGLPEVEHTEELAGV